MKRFDQLLACKALAGTGIVTWTRLPLRTDAPVYYLARLKVVQRVLEVEKVGHARAVDANDHIVAFANLHGSKRRYQQNRELPSRNDEKNQCGHYPNTRKRIMDAVTIGVQPTAAAGLFF